MTEGARLREIKLDRLWLHNMWKWAHFVVCKHLSVTPMRLDEAYAMHGYSIQLQQRQQTSSILTLTISQEYVVCSHSSKMD